VTRNRRLQGRYLSWLLLGTVALFLVLGLVMPDRDFSESENRKLAAFPEFTLSSLTDGSFLSGLGDYVADQFPGRDLWMSLNLTFNRLLGQKEASGVYLCEDNYLMQVPSAPNEVQLHRNLDAINDFAAYHPSLNTVVTIVPNAVTVLADKLPKNAPVRDQKADLNQIRFDLAGMNFVDVTQVLTEHKDEDLYYRTDHHWTSQAALYAFGEIAPRFGIEPPAHASYKVYTVSNTFEGTLSSKSGSHSARDVVQVYAPSTPIQYYVTYDGNQTGICSMYDRDALKGKDHYTVFFGGNYGRVDITTTADTGRCLLVFKDSYANCMMQFLYPYFDHITMIDPRYYYDNVENVIKSESVTDVLYLYNLDTFLGDSSLADVLMAGN
jgi:hypothetical protein